MNKPKPGEVLRCEDGAAIVVVRGSDPVQALIALVEEEYGGEPFAADNPAIVLAAAGLRIETWHYHTLAQAEAGDIDPDQQLMGWWSPNGAGKSFIDVVYYDGSPYFLGEQALEAEEAK